MPHFSDNLSDDQKRSLSFLAPSSLRIKFENEIFSEYLSEDWKLLKFFELLPLQKLCDEICLHLTLSDSILKNASKNEQIAYLSKVIRSCAWFKFYDFIEVIGDLLIESEEMYSKRIQELADTDFYEDPDDLYQDDIILYNIFLSNFDFINYFSNVNEFLSENLIGFIFDHNSRILLKSDNAGLVNAEDYDLASSSELNSKTELNTLLEIVNNSKIQTGIKDSITKVINLFNENKYIETLHILDAVIEHILNEMIKNQNEDPRDFKGSLMKAEHLRDKELLSSDIFYGYRTIHNRRNFTTHESYIPDQETSKIYCKQSLILIRKLLLIL